MEIYLLANDCVKYLQTRRPDLRLRRLYVGTFMTSLNMNGFSVSSLYLSQDESTDTYLSQLDAPTNAPAWSKSCGKDIAQFEYTSCEIQASVRTVSDTTDYIRFEKETSCLADMLKRFLQTISQDLIDIKDYLNKLDSGCGDGDCGDSMATVSQSILKGIENGKFEGFEYPHKVFMHLSEILENGGGSLCILLALFFSAAAKAFAQKDNQKETSNDQIHWFKIWLSAMELGINAVQEYGRAKPNQRSIIDPLTTIKNNLKDYVHSVEASAEKAVNTSLLLKLIVDNTLVSAESTAQMVPRVGRASYVDANSITMPDAGAMAMSSALNSVYKAYIKTVSE